MHRFLTSSKTSFSVFILLSLFFFASTSVSAKTFREVFNINTGPVNYDEPTQLFRGGNHPDSIDACLDHKEFHYNEVHDIWVDGMVRCKFDGKEMVKMTKVGAAPSGIPAASKVEAPQSNISSATPEVRADPKDIEDCKGKRDGYIFYNGQPSEHQALFWSEHCSYLGTVGGAGPLSNSNNNDFGQIFNITSSDDSIFTPVYDGPGVQVPSDDLIPQGISQTKSLTALIVFYTNVTLPYVSVVAVFAFVAAGLFYILSFTNEELNGKAKNMMTYVVIGIVIIFSAYTVVNTLFSFVTFE